MSCRRFAALSLTEPVCDLLTGHQTGLAGASWRPRANLHLTLRFYGDLETEAALALETELAAIALAPFELTLRGGGSFGHPQAHAVWAGAVLTPPLIALQRACEDAARRIGLPASPRAWVPHVTLAYLERTPPEAVARYLQGLESLTIPAGQIRQFQLFNSETALCDANLYRPVATYHAV